MPQRRHLLSPTNFPPMTSLGAFVTPLNMTHIDMTRVVAPKHRQQSRSLPLNSFFLPAKYKNENFIVTWFVI